MAGDVPEVTAHPTHDWGLTGYCMKCWIYGTSSARIYPCLGSDAAEPQSLPCDTEPKREVDWSVLNREFST